MSKSILGLIFVMLLGLQARAEQPIFYISSTDANPGQTIDITFTVDDFSEIISMQFSINWNPNVLEYKGSKSFNASVPGLSASSIGTEEVTDGKLRVQWFEASINPITLPDQSLLFTLEFEVVGNPCQSSVIAITDDPLEIEVGETPAGNDVGLVTNNGQVRIPGQNCIEDIQIIGNSVTGSCGGVACVQFTVQNFTNVVAMGFSLVFDGSVLQFNEIRNFAPLPGFNSGVTNLAGPDSLIVVWFNGNIQNLSLNDGTVLFELCFNVIGSGGQFSQITFGTAPVVEFSDVDNNIHNVTITPAVISAQCALEGFALIGDTVCTTPGGTVCMDVKVNDFDEIVAFQYSINWDSTRFEFVRVEGFGLPGLDEGGFGVPGNPDVKQGQLTVSWIDLSLAGVTLPDYSTIFKLCLRARGTAGQNSPINFSGIPLDIEILNADDSLLVFGLLQGRGEIRQSCEGCDVSFTLIPTSPNCPRETTGRLDLTVTTNCPETPTYLWNTIPPVTTQDLNGIAAGSYTVTITVGSNIVVATGVVTDPPAIGVTGTVTNPNPIGTSTGAVDITVTGGTPPFTFQWSTPPGSTTEDISNVPAGSYSVTVTDSKGCTFIPDPYIVGAELAAAVTNVACPGGSNGAINLSVGFGTGPYTFLWAPGGATTEDISNLMAGQYCVTVTDSGNATSTACFNVTQPEPLTLTATISHDVNENCQGAIDLNVTGGVMPYSYSWSNGPTSQDIIQLCPGEYCVTVSYPQGCSQEMCFTVLAGGLIVQLVATQYGNFQTSCNGVCDGEITSVVQGGSGTLIYQWSNNATTEDLSNICAGTYTLTVTDQAGRTATASVVITSPPAITLSYIATSPSDFISSNGALAVVVNGGRPPYTYQWTGPASGSTASLNNVPAGTYTLLVTDASGCEIRDNYLLLPDLDVGCYEGMSVFTPNSDGKNDFFIITCVNDFDNRLRIFNRVGGLVYETNNYQNTWIGVDRNNEPVPDGGYLWVLEVFRPDGTTQLIKGTVTLLRTAD